MCWWHCCAHSVLIFRSDAKLLCSVFFLVKWILSTICRYSDQFYVICVEFIELLVIHVHLLCEP